jgi:hypothetical protein
MLFDIYDLNEADTQENLTPKIYREYDRAESELV